MLAALYAWLFPARPMMMGGVPRSSKWPRVEREFLAAHPRCEVCGTKDDLNAHHVIPYHVDKTKELDAGNLQCLCRTHHFWWGHLGSWASWNSSVREDAATWRRKIENRP